jgi:uncharacterized protein (TIGR00290 family)
MKAESAAVLWTGGKDSSLAFYEAELLGIRIECLVTFVPHGAKFRAHPLGFMKYQDEALGLKHYMIEVKEPFKPSYRSAILSLKERRGIDTVITGDISEVDSYPNWIVECCENSGVNVLMPLWKRDRLGLLRELLTLKLKVIFSCVKKPWFSEEWLGRALDEDSIKQLCEIKSKSGLDICGEGGEYHTLVLDGPQFKKSIHINAYSKHAENSLLFINIQSAVLGDK